MYNKNTKTVTTYTAARQKITKTSESSVTSSRTQTTSTGYVSPYRSSTANNRAVANINSSATSAASTYQPVYNQTRTAGASGSLIRNAPVYRSLQHTPSSATRTALTTAAERLTSFGTNQERNRSQSVVNSEQAASSASPTWRTAPTPSSNAVSSVVNSERAAASTSPTWKTVQTPSIAQDARPFGAAYASAVRRPSDTSNIQRYDLRNEGYVLIFHHLFKNDDKLYRKGSEQDLKLIKNFFRKYRAKVADPCEDYTVKKVKRKMAEIRTKNFSNYSCLIVIIMSHGGTKELIRANDEMYNFEAEIVEPILMNSSLKDKPKLFFVQACKGDAMMETDFHPRATNKFDMLKCYSTYEGTVSLRNILTGTFFIQTLFQMIEENADKEIIDIMRLIRNTFSITNVQQAPTETSTLTKQFYFNDLKKK